MSFHRSTRIAILSVALAAGIVACGGSAAPSNQADAEAQLCTSIDAFGASVTAMTELDPATASIDDVQAAKATAQTAWDQVKTSAAAIAEADEAALEAAWTGLAASVDDIPQDQPIADVVAGVKTSAAAIPAAVTEMKNGVGCA
jgi:hypothetical protein